MREGNKSRGGRGVKRSRRGCRVLEETRRAGEQTERCWCLFSLWLAMGGCSQHKHMPSWLTHFLLHSASQHWATQAQDTTASCACVCLGMCASWLAAFMFADSVVNLRIFLFILRTRLYQTFKTECKYLLIIVLINVNSLLRIN